jgi:hypothetical protein
MCLIKKILMNYCYLVLRLTISAETVLSGKGFFDTALTSLTVLGVGLSVLFIKIQLILSYYVSNYLNSANLQNGMAIGCGFEKYLYFSCHDY